MSLRSITRGVQRQFKSLTQDDWNAVLVFVSLNCYQGASSSDWSRKSHKYFQVQFQTRGHVSAHEARSICSQRRDFCAMCGGGLWVTPQDTLSPRLHKYNLFTFLLPWRAVSFLNPVDKIQRIIVNNSSFPAVFWNILSHNLYYTVNVASTMTTASIS